ncbi:hypothetical protein HMN09_00319500 [Mycena chlorophos]|uniref:HNH nuclease domain-containing protein n=1 Tax=Mycena chlorophos TaxID=658473 RepID=A0A8H6TK20_MYCCL|nr:hypothetical protein HMN09_00319500 [Mycena chlorophos]
MVLVAGPNVVVPSPPGESSDSAAVAVGAHGPSTTLQDLSSSASGFAFAAEVGVESTPPQQHETLAMRDSFWTASNAMYTTFTNAEIRRLLRFLKASPGPGRAWEAGKEVQHVGGGTSQAHGSLRSPSESYGFLSSPMTLPRQPQLDAEGQQHWSLILEAEAHFQVGDSEAGPYNDPLVGIRVLGHLLLALWPPCQPFGDSPYRRLCREVADIRRSAGSNEECYRELSRTGLLYRDHIFQIFWSDGETVSQEDTEVSAGQTAVEVPKAEDYLQYTLARDGYRCLVSGVYNIDSLLRSSELQQQYSTTNSGCSIVRTAHILSTSASETSTRAILRLFGLDTGMYNEVSTNLYTPSNTLSLQSSLRIHFSRLQFWLEPVHDQPNTYDVNPSPRLAPVFDTLVPRPRSRITLSGSGSAAGPVLPDPTLLAMRALCARVVHASGAVEQWDGALAVVDAP